MAVPMIKNFRWRKTVSGKAGYYDDFTISMKPNYWMYANSVLDYGRMCIYGIAFIT